MSLGGALVRGAAVASWGDGGECELFAIHDEDSFAIATGMARAGTSGNRSVAHSPASPRPRLATRTASMCSPSTAMGA